MKENKEKKKRKGPYELFFKRFFDFILSLLAIIILSPVFLIVWICSKISIGGKAIFAQYRPGKNGKIFKLYKFRSMTNKTDDKGDLLPDAQRITKFGKIIRKLSLDELPQLFNILKGDMSIVGPRPLLVEYLELYNEEQKHRHDVRPGLTGLAQISGRNSITWEEKFKEDIQYIENISLIEDIKIILKTVTKVFNREGISQEGNETMERFKGSEEKTNV